MTKCPAIPDPLAWVRAAYRAGWYVNAAVNDQAPDYLAACEDIDWQDYRHTREFSDAAAELSRDRPLVNEGGVARLRELVKALVSGRFSRSTWDESAIARDRQELDTWAADIIALLPGGEEYSKDDGLYSAKPRVTPAARTEASPIQMILFCPACGLQHIDAADTHDQAADKLLADQTPWDNPPHRSHLCHSCKHIWRPADVATEGVAHITSMGLADSPIRVGAAQPHVSAIGGETSYQARVHGWMLACFGAEIAADTVERGDRFLEEVFELLQWLGYDPGRIEPVRDYVWGRPVGEGHQEVGGVMVCLAALCNATSLDLDDAAEVELARILAPEIMLRIRAKQAAKPKMSPLPVALSTPPTSLATLDGVSGTEISDES